MTIFILSILLFLLLTFISYFGVSARNEIYGSDNINSNTYIIKVSKDFSKTPNSLEGHTDSLSEFISKYSEVLNKEETIILNFQDCLQVGSKFLYGLCEYLCKNSLKDRIIFEFDAKHDSDKVKRYFYDISIS